MAMDPPRCHSLTDGQIVIIDWSQSQQSLTFFEKWVVNDKNKHHNQDKGRKYGERNQSPSAFPKATTTKWPLEDQLGGGILFI